MTEGFQDELDALNEVRATFGLETINVVPYNHNFRRARFEGNPQMAEFFKLTVFGDLEQSLGDRAKMVEYFNAWNQSVIDEVPPEKLLVFRASDGWEPLCAFLGVSVPPEPYPRVNSREEMTERTGEIDTHAGPPPPEVFETMIRGYLDDLRVKAFGAAA